MRVSKNEFSHVGYLTEISENMKVFFVCDESESPDLQRRVRQVLELEDEVLDYVKELEGLQTSF